MKKTSILLSAALMFSTLTASAQTKITFDSDDYKAVGVYDSWEESPFRTGELEGNAGIASNPNTEVDAVLGAAPNSTANVLAFQRSRYGSNAYGVRIDLKEPVRVTKQLQHIHVMTYLKDKPTASRMMVIGLGKRLEESWSWQTGEEEQFWALTSTRVEPKDGWQDIVVSFKGFSYSAEEKLDSGINIHSLVIVPDVRTPQADKEDWVAYFDEIEINNDPNKRFSTELYALTYDAETSVSRTDRGLKGVGLTVGNQSYSATPRSGKVYSNNTTTNIFSATAGTEIQPTFNYGGNWMSGYVYVDWNGDARFDYALNDNGTPAEGSDVVSYNAVQIDGTWRKSDGTTTDNGNTIGAGVPRFTIPAGTPTGFYRMRYKVDWNEINPAGNGTTDNNIVKNGGGIIDLILDVHGKEVTVNASQLNGDIVLAKDETALQNYVMDYEQPLTVKIIPAPGFVQYGFKLKYGYDVAAKEQLNDKENPNWVEVTIPFSDIAGDGTYTIPAEYLRGSQVSIMGDMQQVQQYSISITGAEGKGSASYANIPVTNGGTINATQFFTAEQLIVTPVEGYTYKVAVDEATKSVSVEYEVGKPVYEKQQVVTAINPENRYTLECRSGAAHNTNRFIGLTDDGVVNGQSATATLLQFEPANETGGYYIKVVDAEKYINHNGSNISASAEKSTVWTFGVGGKDNVEGVVTFTIGNDKYLNNNGSDCNDGSCTMLKGNTHAGGPGSGNACSLWEMTEYVAKTVSPTPGEGEGEGEEPTDPTPGEDEGDENEDSGIDNAEVDLETAIIYDIFGRRIEKLTKGLFIVNGKLVLIR